MSNAQPCRVYLLFVGVDIAVTSFTATWTTGEPAQERARTFDQTPTGFTSFQTWLTTTGVLPAATVVVVEATGSYWVTLAVTLHQASYCVSIINPAHAQTFDHSLPRRAKTDGLMPNSLPGLLTSAK